MDKNNDALTEAYELILEASKVTPATKQTANTVKTNIKVGGVLGGDKTEVSPVGDTNQYVKGEIKKPAEVKGKTTVGESKAVPTTFDKLFTSIIKEEDEIVDAPDVQDDEFDTDTGDFPEAEGEEGTEDMEAQEGDQFGVIADLFTQLAEAFRGMSSEHGGEELGDEFEDMGAGEDLGGEELGGEEVGAKPFGESVTIGKIPAPTTPKTAKKTQFSPTMKKNPKNNIGTSGKGKASLPAGKDRSGTLSKAPSTKFGPKMSQTVGGSGPISKGGNEAFIK